MVFLTGFLTEDMKPCVHIQFSLLNLFRAVGLDKMQHFNHKSPAAVREMFLTSGNVVKNMIIEEIKKAGSYGLLIDEVTD